MSSLLSVRIVSMRDGVDQSVDSARNPITSASNVSLGRLSECTPFSSSTADRHDTNIQIQGTHP
jgi:hypothetical protein